MRLPRPLRRVVALAGALVVAVAALGSRADAQTTATAPIAATATVGGLAPAAPVPAGFLGVSTEWDVAAQTAGPADDPNDVFESLVRQLAPGERPVLRIGGDSTDRTWWPIRGIHIGGLTNALTPASVASIARVTDDLNAKLILGINLEANNPEVTQREAEQLISGGIHHASIDAFEIGNEPNLYGSFGWYYGAHHRIITGRRPGYDVTDYLRDVRRDVAGVQGAALAGPALGDSSWLAQLARIVRAEPRASTVTYHAYPLSCWGVHSSLEYPSLANLLAPESSIGLAAGVAGFARIAHAAHRLFRVDELGSEACGGRNGISNTFASALWVLNTLFAMASDGVDGVNVHTFPDAAYRLFGFSDAGGRWSGTVAPEYYGLLTFAAIAPAGSRLLAATTDGDPSLQSWALRTPGGATRVVLVNSSVSHPAVTSLSVPAGTDAAVAGLLTAPSASSTNGVTLDGLSFASPTLTGRLTGTLALTAIAPVSANRYRITVPAASAALVGFS